MQIKDVLPSKTHGCPCGSGEMFDRCCNERYEACEKFREAKLLDQGDYLAALQEIRAHFTWRVLAHKAHTAPVMNTHAPYIEQLLDSDVETLSHLMDLTRYALFHLDRIGEMQGILDRLSDAIEDQRWKHKIIYHRAAAYLTEECETKAVAVMSRLSVGQCADVSILGLYISLMQSKLTPPKLLKVIEKALSLTSSKEDVLRFQLARATVCYRICATVDAVKYLRNGIRSYLILPEMERTFYGQHLLANALYFLGCLDSDTDKIRQSKVEFSALLSKDGTPKLTNVGRASYLQSVGRCEMMLGDYAVAQKAYESSLETFPDSLTQIYLAEAVGALGDLEKARDILESINVSRLDHAGNQDFSLTFGALAACSCDSRDLDKARRLLEIASKGDPSFSAKRDQLLIHLLKTEPVREVGRFVAILRKLNRWIIISPSLLGMGLDVNAMLTDMIGSDKPMKNGRSTKQ